VTLEFPEAAVIDEVSAIETPSGAPADLAFSWDCFRFALDGLDAGSAVEVKIFLPEDATPESYYKYGPTSDDGTPHWYEFMYDGATGAEINGSVVTLHLVDGQRGDDDLARNGSILDDGGPVVAAAGDDTGDDGDGSGEADVEDDTGGDGSSGCFISTVGGPVLFPLWGRIAASLGGALFFSTCFRRRKRD
jgi:hypothetical protein